jgi:DNA polymerase-1
VKRTLLIDGDTLIYEAAAATECEIQWEPWLWTLHGDFNAAVAHLDDVLGNIIEKLRGDQVIIALSDSERWRPKVMPTYKANRKGRKPVTYKPLREYVHEKYTTYQRPTLEGDDVLGILVTNPRLFPKTEKIVVSIDKDMQTLPGLHVNYGHARGSEDWETFVRSISEPQADRFHLLQTLTGDRTDGYPGCPKIGPVSAEKLLPENGTVASWWPTVVGSYAKQGLGEAVALENARVARICRWTDYDFQKKEVILWSPP